MAPCAKISSEPGSRICVVFTYKHDTLRSIILGIGNTDIEGYVSAYLHLFISDKFEKRAEVETHGVGTSTDWAG